MRKMFLLAIVAAVFCTIISCHKDDTEAANIIGTWDRTVNGVAFKLYITDSTHFSYTASNINGSPFVAAGTYTGVYGQAAFKETSGSSNCFNVVGTYTYTVTTTLLSLNAGTDHCGGSFASRATIFTGDWTKE